MKKTEITPDVTIKENHTIKYEFTKEELERKAKDLAIACHDKGQLEAEKREIMSSFKYKIDGKDVEINMLSNQISNGFEMRTVKCEIKKYFDKKIKEVWFDGVLYDTLRLTEADYQLETPMEE